MSKREPLSPEVVSDMAILGAETFHWRMPAGRVTTDDLGRQLAISLDALRSIRDVAQIAGKSWELFGTIEGLCDYALRGEVPPTDAIPPPHAPVKDEGVVTSVRESSTSVLVKLNADMRWHLDQIRQHADHIGSRTIVALAESALKGGG